MNVKASYEAELAARGYSADPAQLRAIQALERCAQEWAAFKEMRSNAFKKLINRPSIPRGVYMYGGVGRGKSFLMDCFYSSVPVVRKVRIHFHEFMRGVHTELDELRGMADPLDEVAMRIAKRYRLICFDEFHVSDIAGAMILHRLLDGLFANGVTFLMTSNYKPDDLYPDGLHRDRIQPAIALLNAQLDIINVDVGVDYRRQTLAQLNTYLYPLNEESDLKLAKAFGELAETADEPAVLEIESRKIQAVRRAGSVVWFDFPSLCRGPRSQNDYLEIASQFHTLILSGVPKMSAGMSSEARRFTWLIDVLYDHKVKLILSAQVHAEQLYIEGAMANEFARTVSRIVEMQSQEYLDAPKRNAVKL